MGIGLDHPAAWRGWEQSDGSTRSVLTSAHLGRPRGSRRGWFPKTRSWLALDSPLELLSPLSVLRLNFAAAAVAFTLVGSLGATTRADLVTTAVVGVCTLVIWVVLMRIDTIGPGPSRLLSAYWTMAIAVLIVADRTEQSAVVLGFLLVPSAVFVSMFFGLRIVLWQIGLACLALWLALSAGRGLGVGLVLALVAVSGMATAPIAVLLVSRASRRSGLVDPETGLPNGLGLAVELGPVASPTSLIAVVALGGVAECREALGYPAAAELLRRAVERLGEVAPSGSLIGRVDGDDVILVVESDSPGISRLELARLLGGTVTTGRYLVGDVEVSMRAHVGITAPQGEGERLADLIRQASLSAQRAARLGVAVVEWDGDRDAMTGDDLTLLASLRRALDGQGLSLAYQLQFGGESASPVSAEALIRWDLPDGSRVPPDRYISLAERTGLVDRLTRWVVTEALDAQVRWRDDGVDLPVSVNVSARNLADSDLPRWVIDALAARGLPASCLTVEVTESAVTDAAQAQAVLGPLRAHGVRISMDDFGTGYTSLSALPGLPLDELKIDQGFVRRSVTSAADDAIVATTCDLGHRLGLTVVAEGVEDAGLAARMLAHGADLLQGYYLARPLAEPDVLAFLDAVIEFEESLVGPTS